ncbi:carboxylesterase family protein [Sphingobium sp. AP49]|uniref:carboxylesterase/lipase family protein n=1 Tax=Sphingobium sp. AP49 TaxID=1144307 RepID=UPI00026EE1B8|nr:carboxylesterase family protein [Sphingobium sp. AP49]WHO40043.1 carboxylesterase family protein [Sphingobium sp. AP49]
MRRIAIVGLSATLLSTGAAPARSPLIPIPTVQTDAGTVHGAVEAGVMSWKGIPFAAPPVGDLRWRMPQPVQPWQGVRETTAYRNDCMQLPFPSDAAPLGTPPAEDCLYVNVWKPASASTKLPVLFWIYGGGFVNGGSSPPTYSGAALAKQGLMVVSFNYRLGRFGTFAHPALAAADEDKGLTGNYGLMDQVAALQWVKRNIARFGGDPANITIIGESAGGMSVHALLTSPLSQGLFQRAVIMSGGDGQMIGPKDGSAATIGQTFATAKGIKGSDAAALKALRALPADQVVDGLNLAGMFSGQLGAYSPPFPDGTIAVNPAAAYAAGRFAHVPVMVGATGADIGGPTGFMVGGARTVAATLADARLPVYAYRFDYVATSIGQPGAGHASDIPFFFDTQAIKYGAQTSARENEMGRTISAYIVNFARSGNPNGANLPAWPRYDAGEDRIMLFNPDGKATAQKDPLPPVTP